MQQASPYAPRFTAALFWKVLHFLQVILHIGAHRTGTSSLQSAILKNQYNLRQNGLTFWGPRTTRGGIFSGLLRRPATFDQDGTRDLVKRNAGAIRIEMDRLRRARQKTLLISEENIMGTMPNNLRQTTLYPGLRRRLARFADIFDKSCQRIAMTIRPYENYWASAIAHTVPAGHPMPDEDSINNLSYDARGWRQVIEDVSAAFPSAEICIWEFDRFCDKTASQFKILTRGQRNLRFRPFSERHNTGATAARLRQVLLDRGKVDAARKITCGAGRYVPFDAAQKNSMRQRYQADLAWLRNGADQRAMFIQSADDILQKPAVFAKRGGL